LVPSGCFLEQRSVLFGAYRDEVADLRANRQRAASTAGSAEAHSRPVRVPLFKVLIRRATFRSGVLTARSSNSIFIKAIFTLTSQYVAFE
jgi:hypothetical protein